jgi:hypothetical protein
MELPRGSAPPLPCSPEFILSASIYERPAPDGVVWVREVWFVDRHGEKDWWLDTWPKGTPEC